MDISKLSDSDLRAIERGDLSAVSDEGLLALSAADSGQESRALDAPNALASGFMRGLTRMAGAPVDTVANVLDLGKAALGAPYTALTGKPAPEALQVRDRSDVVGSGENLLRTLGKNKISSAVVNPANPEYEGGYLQTIGGGLAGASTPAQAATLALGAAMGKGVYDATGNNALAITASMTPMVAPGLTSSAMKRAIRGGEEGRQAMVGRIARLREAGVERPTLALASGNGALGGVETVLQTVPGSMGVFQRARDEATAGMQARAAEAAGLASPTSGRLAAGNAVQRDLRDFHSRRVVPAYVRVNDRAEGAIGTNTPATVHNSIDRATALSTPNPAAPETSSMRIQPMIADMRRRLAADAGGAPARMDAAGMSYAAVPQTGIPYRELKAMRTGIGEEAASLDNVGRPVQGQIRSMYGALSQDMENAALMHDLRNGPSNQLNRPSSASGALTRANDIYSGGLARQERTAPFANNPVPEAAFDAVARTPAKALSTFNAIKKSILPSTRGSVAATIIDDLGTASPGNQTAAGDGFSPATFLTNWNKLTPAGREALFSGFPNAAQAHAQVAAVADAADMMRQNSRHWANPSGTAANTSGRELLRGLGLGVPAALAGLGSWTVPLGVLGAAGGARLASNTLTSPRVVNWAATQTPRLSESDIGALTKMMVSSGQLDKGRK